MRTYGKAQRLFQFTSETGCEGEFRILFLFKIYISRYCSVEEIKFKKDGAPEVPMPDAQKEEVIKSTKAEL